LAVCLSNWIFNSDGLEKLGLEKKIIQGFGVSFFAEFFLIKGSRLITFFSRGDPVPCCPNMRFHEEIERIESVAVNTIYYDQAKCSDF